jgi:hypothetical protein
MRRNGLLLAALAIPLAGQMPSAPSRAVTVSDSIEMNVADGLREGIACFSPDKSAFVVLTHKGSIRTNSNVYTLWLYRSAHVFRLPHGEVILNLSSTTSVPAIRDIRWIDNRRIVFLGTAQANLKSPIYSLDVQSRKLSKLSAYDGSIMAFDATADLSVVAFVARPAPESYVGPSSADRGVMISTQQLADLLADKKQGKDRLILQRRGSDAKEVPLAGRLILPNLYLAPDGRRLVVAALLLLMPMSGKSTRSGRIFGWSDTF